MSLSHELLITLYWSAPTALLLFLVTSFGSLRSRAVWALVTFYLAFGMALLFPVLLREVLGPPANDYAEHVVRFAACALVFTIVLQTLLEMYRRQTFR